VWSDDRGGEQMVLTGLNVGEENVSLGSAMRSRVRAAVHDCEILGATGANIDLLQTAIRRTEGRIANVRILHPKEGRLLWERLRAVKKLARILPA
jgi:hypothetical protein